MDGRFTEVYIGDIFYKTMNHLPFISLIIPCLNEERTIGVVLESIPKSIPGIDELIILIIDDGSTDRTVDIARRHGVKHFVRHRRNRGLGQSFHDGVERALELGADIIVNTDGDNQYPQDRIADLVQPILDDKADIVIADRQTQTIEHFSPAKKFLQRFGSAVVNKAAGTNLPDAASGFRAYSKDAILQLNTITRFSYCMETIIQAGNKRLAITSLPVVTNPPTRKSRLFKHTGEHVVKSAAAIIRAFAMYKPYLIFGWLSLTLFLLGCIPFARYFYFYIEDHTGRGHLQSLIVGSLFITGAFLCLVLNIIADLIRINRILIEDNLEHTKRVRFKQLDD